MVTEASQWKQSVKAVELEVPSGNTCLARRVDLRKLLNDGAIPNMLMPIAKDAMKGKSFDASELMKDIDESQLQSMLDLMDRVVLDCVLKPELHPAPASEDQRSDDLLYVDEVDFEDRQFIFNWAVGGTRDLERFRREQAALMESVHTGTSDEGEAIVTPGD